MNRVSGLWLRSHPLPQAVLPQPPATHAAQQVTLETTVRSRWLGRWPCFCLPSSQPSVHTASLGEGFPCPRPHVFTDMRWGEPDTEASRWGRGQPLKFKHLPGC